MLATIPCDMTVAVPAGPSIVYHLPLDQEERIAKVGYPWEIAQRRRHKARAALTSVILVLFSGHTSIGQLELHFPLLSDRGRDVQRHRTRP